MSIASLSALQTLQGEAQRISVRRVSGSLLRRWGKLIDTWEMTGYPDAGTYPTASLAGSALDKSSTGAIPFRAAGAGQQLYLGGAQISHQLLSNSSITSEIILVHVFDRLWHNGAIANSVTSRQSWSPPAITRYVSGEGVSLWLRWVASGSGTTTTTLTLEYTNQSGTATSTTAVIRQGSDGMSSPGDVWPLPLAAGDTGIRELTASRASNSGSAGSYGFMLCKYLGTFVAKPTSTPQGMTSFLRGLPAIHNDACLCFALQSCPAPTNTDSNTVRYNLSAELSLIEG